MAMVVSGSIANSATISQEEETQALALIVDMVVVHNFS